MARWDAGLRPDTSLNIKSARPAALADEGSGALVGNKVEKERYLTAAVAEFSAFHTKSLRSARVSSMPEKKILPSHDLMIRIRQAFHSHGYDRLTMIDIANYCEFSRRALYFYFSSKEEAFRALISYFNRLAIQQGLEAGEAVRRAGGSALDILAETLDIRYGETRRSVSTSPHLVELNGEVFRRCHDLMVESALVFHRDLEALIHPLVADGLLVLKPDVSAADLARLLADGARGVNQTLPPLAAEEFSPRYRAMTKAILFGSAAAVTESRDAAPDFADRQTETLGKRRRERRRVLS